MDAKPLMIFVIACMVLSIGVGVFKTLDNISSPPPKKIQQNIAPQREQPIKNFKPSFVLVSANDLPEFLKTNQKRVIEVLVLREARIFGKSTENFLRVEVNGVVDPVTMDLVLVTLENPEKPTPGEEF